MRGRPAGLELALTWTLRGRPLLTRVQCERLVAAALRRGRRRRARLSLVFVGDRALARMHAERLGDPAPTDVITFDLGEPGGVLEGELYLSVERARAEARARGLDARRELALYVVHGVLHLLGHDDHAPRDRRRMIAAERAVLAPLGFAHAELRT